MKRTICIALAAVLVSLQAKTDNLHLIDVGMGTIVITNVQILSIDGAGYLLYRNSDSDSTISRVNAGKVNYIEKIPFDPLHKSGIQFQMQIRPHKRRR